MTGAQETSRPRISFGRLMIVAVPVVVAIVVLSVIGFRPSFVRVHTARTPSFIVGQKTRDDALRNPPYADVDAACRWALKDAADLMQPGTYNPAEALAGCKYEDSARAHWPFVF